MNKKPVYYMQTDPKWKNEPYRTSAEKSTIGSAGCGPSCMAMVIAEWVDPKVTPVTTTQWSMAHGYKATGNGTYHTYFKPQAAAYGLECKQLNGESFLYMSKSNAEKYHKMAHDYVDDGYLVICLMGKGNWTRGGHFILWYSNSGNNVYINDPASTKQERAVNTFDLLKSQVRFYWVITPPKEVISMTNSEVKAMIKQETEAAVKAAMADYSGIAPSGWAADAWYGAFLQKVFDGTAPQGNLTREQAAAVLSRLGLIKTAEVPKDFDWKTLK